MAGSVLRKPDPMDVLSNSWYHLRLSVRHPQRVPTWDAIVLTAASPEQAELYEWQLSRAKRMERIADTTITMAVPDPQGARIGSGAATLSAIRALADHLARNEPQVLLESVNGEEPYGSNIVNQLVKMRILLVHAGGDSKRVPWANPMGKAFLPLPYLAEEDPDGPVPLLFDHILAVSSCVLKAFKDKGGLFIMTGDVLPCFDSSVMAFPDDGACVVTVPTTLDVATKHGVIVISSTGTDLCGSHKKLDIVEMLLQKPSLKELENNGAIGFDGRALLDTGIFAIRGKAWKDIIKLSSASPRLISKLLNRKEEVSLYEDLAAAWVSGKHEWLKTRPLGLELVNALGDQKLFAYCAYDLLFLHFGTSSEILDHLSEGNGGRVGRRHLSSIPASTVCDLATSAAILSSEIASGVSVGDDSLIYDSILSSGVQIGSRCVVVGVHIDQERRVYNENGPFLVLPDRHCLWEVPLVGDAGRVILCCGIEDNPKSAFYRGGTFCGKPWAKVFFELGIRESNLWNHEQKQKYLWNAKLFPVVPQAEGLKLAMWLMGFNLDQNENMLDLWENSQRVSLEEMHRSIDYRRLCAESSNHRSKLAAGIAKACISYGLLGRNLSRLCAEILEGEKNGTDICKSFLSLCPNPQTSSLSLLNLPQSRAYQAQVDLHRSCKQEQSANVIEERVWAAVAAETAAAVRQEVEDQPSKPLNGICDGYEHHYIANIQPLQPKRAHVELPVRVDFVGGWSDTPPWSLERIGCVLNMAIHLEGTLPVGAEIVVRSSEGVLIHDDAGNQLHIQDIRSIAPPFHEDDQFRLVKAALTVTGIVNISDKIMSSTGLEISTWAKVPRGSGLGTSSILAAAVIKGLQHVIGGDESNENVARLVLVLEQLMGTGGGWQDQIGGLYPGIKCTTSLPGNPLRLNIETVSVSSQIVLELEQRMLVVFTGQVRLAHGVLQKVVIRYLQRDALLITSIKRLAKLAKIGRESLMSGNLDDLGRIMLEAWRLHQELDPYCSNAFVDKLFEYSDPFCCGYKLVGAGGGGFALLLARNREAADDLKGLLKASEFPIKIYNWSMCLDGISGLS